MKRTQLLPVLVSLSFILLGTGKAQAALLCVTPASTGACNDCTATGCGTCPATDTCTLQNALTVAQGNSANDIVEVGPGDYNASVDGTYTYSGTVTENFTLTIIGSSPTARVFCPLNDTQGMFIQTSGTDDAADVTVQNITFQNCNALGNDGGGLQVSADSADIAVESCQFLDNVADVNGGGLRTFTDRGNTLINSNLFLRNKTVSDGNGGGLYSDTDSGSITLTNNILAENQSIFEGGGAWVKGFTSLLQIVDNTITNNMAPDTGDGFGGGIFAFVDETTGVIDLYNNIIFGNAAGTDGADIFTCEQGGTVNLFNNDFLKFVSGGVSVEDGCGLTPTINQDATNLMVNPTFVNAASDNFHLQATSPVIDKGNLTPPPPVGLPNPDFDGNTRPFGPLPDMGAIEFIPSPTPIPFPTPSPLPPPVITGILEGSCVSCGLNASASGRGLGGFWIAGLALGGMIAARRKKSQGGESTGA